jgi:hypothetical protein
LHIHTAGAQLPRSLCARRVLHAGTRSPTRTRAACAAAAAHACALTPEPTLLRWPHKQSGAAAVCGRIQSVLQAIQLVNTLTQQLDIHAAMESVRSVALELLECDRVTLFLLLESQQELR